MPQIRDKRTADERYFDIDCSLLLGRGETILEITSLAADTGGLTFSTRSINDVAITYPDGRVVLPGQVVQVLIAGGQIGALQPFLLCTVRAVLRTNFNPALEATVLLRLIDAPDL